MPNNFIIYGIAGISGIFAGIICSNGSSILIAIFASIAAMIVIATSRKALLWTIILGGLVFSGLAKLYLPEIKYLHYLVPLITFILFLYAFLDLLYQPVTFKVFSLSSITLWSTIFIILAMTSMIINWNSIGATLMSAKQYFQIWLLFYALILINWKTDEIDFLPKGILLIAFLQLPFVFHEYFYLVPKRIGLGGETVPVDIVVGTFGGDQYAGGENAVLTTFLFIVITCILGLWKHGAISCSKAAGLAIPIMVPIFLNETKISAIYLPIAYVMLFHREILRRPNRFIITSIITLGILSILFTALIYHNPNKNINSWTELVSNTFKKETSNIYERRNQYSELSRWTSLTFWVKENISASPTHILIGYGPGSSRVINFGPGSLRIQDSGINIPDTFAEIRYGGLRIGNTALSALLWDTGILGTISVFGLFLAAFNTAGRLVKHHQSKDPYRAGIFDGLRAGTCILALSVAHKDYFIYYLPYQTFLMIILGYLVYSETHFLPGNNNVYGIEDCCQ